jgi:hypothetical protein
MPHHSIVGLVPHQHHALGLSFNHLQLSRSIPLYQYPPYPYPPPLVSGSSSGNTHPLYIYPPHPIVGSSDENAHPLYPYHPPPLATHYIHTLLPQPVVHRVVLLLNLFAPEVVITQVARRIPLIQLKLLRG